MKSAHLLITLSLGCLPLKALAGGDYVAGVVTEFSGGGGNYTFEFVQTDKGRPLLEGCTKYKVVVQHAMVPWFSWLPFVTTRHPSIEQTDKAATYLKTAKVEVRSVYFGYAGSGLRHSGVPCSYLSKGLALEQDGDLSFVLAYHDPT